VAVVTLADFSAEPRHSPTTQPDQLDSAAWRAFALMDGEVVRRVWRTGRGDYLVLTTLRCILLWQRRELFRPTEWQSGPQVLLFDVRPPRVLFGRFVEVAPATSDGGAPIRVAVAQPEDVAEEIAQSLPAAHRDWVQRRSKALALLAEEKRRHDLALAAARSGRPPTTLTVRCAYCGNSMLVTARSCPHCGAPAP
jgi:hypothetical protein